MWMIDDRESRLNEFSEESVAVPDKCKPQKGPIISLFCSTIVVNQFPICSSVKGGNKRQKSPSQFLQAQKINNGKL